MVYFDCHNTTLGAAGAGCQKSCHTLDMDCVSVPSDPLRQPHTCSAPMGTCGEAHSLAPGDPCPQAAGPAYLWPRCRPWGSTKLCLLPPSTAPSVCPAVCVPTGWWPLATAAASLCPTALVCTTRPATSRARSSGWAATPGMGRGSDPNWGRVPCSGRHRPASKSCPHPGRQLGL